MDCFVLFFSGFSLYIIYQAQYRRKFLEQIITFDIKVIVNYKEENAFLFLFYQLYTEYWIHPRIIRNIVEK